ncbi:hypothetical protein CO121_01215 [bacterium (Candidatus Gribaldobacteria) CG_4_9_14_3_um_filter_36_15]|uniref:SHS2 domain-containing protein n=2 Tax=Candidatus Gribaldobacteria TaxID=2798536 RepID=A0A2M7VKT5_9BACT|nr:MAG: hypothetical protein COX73_01630 [bacterium (Candidatus Gribaldobacteria) CG_4_10_14_0_2_um_filter_36_18]PJB09192.1 MAG: hypothetical protein CO121_01215 [bacterium (Candidatus Gribaldobacteria) CG_4_9_14_3_um_filter_36_15]
MFKIKKEKKKDFLVFDIGSGRIKGLILEKEGGKNRVKRFASKSFEKFGIFQTAVFEKDLLERTLSQVIGELKSGDKLLPKSILVGLSPEMLKGRTTTLSFKRSSPERIIEEEEEKIILDLVLDKSQRKVAKRFGEIYKIAPSEFQVLKKEVIETKISGYKVSSILGKKGKLFDFEILVIFTLKNYLKIFNLIKKSFIFKEAILVHEVEGLISWLKNKKNFSGTFIDIGSRFTQFFLVKDGLLKWMGEFEEGGDIFTQVLSENLGLTQKEAEDLKLRFSKEELSSGSKKIIEGILAQPLNFWFNRLKQELKECGDFVFPQGFYLFGGGSLLPGIKKILRNGDWGDRSGLPTLNFPKVKFILPRDLPVEDKSGFLKGPQETGIIFLALSV